MKFKFSRGAILGLALATAPFVGGCKGGSSTALAEAVPAAPAVENAANSEVDFAAANASTSTAPVKAEPAEPNASKPAPADVKLSSNAAQIVKLAQAGVDETVMLSYVTNSTGTFNLGSEEIIYLNDLGVENSVVTAMIEHDRILVAASQAPAPVASAAPIPTASPPPPAESATEAAYVAPPTQPVTVNYFYSSLAPYGSWVEIDGYGRCWQPTVAVVQPTWQPYCDRGHWVYTDCGWYWYSDYSWGYNTFHYGRWFRHARYGWCWNPDTVWGPAWVTWRYSNDYCGWAPLPPHSYYRPGIGFSYYDRSVGFSFNFGLSADCYAFVPFSRFCDSRPYRYRAPRNHVVNIYNNTTVINNYGSGNNNTVINHGIPVDRVAAATHTTIRPISTRETSSHPRRGEHVQRSGTETVIYRPVSSSGLTSAQREGTAQTGSKSVLPKSNPPGERRRSESVDSTASTSRPSVLPKSNPPGEHRSSGSTVTSSTENRHIRGTIDSPASATVTSTERNNTEVSRRQPGLPRTETQNTVNTPAASTPTIIGSRERRENERHESVQPKTAPLIMKQPETATRGNRETTPPNALIFRGNHERSQVSASPSAQTEQPVSPRNSASRSSPRSETRTTPPVAVNPAPTVVTPAPSVSHRVERQEPIRSAPAVSPRTERQESYRAAPSVSPRVERQEVYRSAPTTAPHAVERSEAYRSSPLVSPHQSASAPPAYGRSSANPGASQSARQPQSSQSQSRGNSSPGWEKKSKD